MSERDVERAGDAPSDAEALVGDTATSDPRTERQGVAPSEATSRESATMTPDSVVPPRSTEHEEVEQVIEPELSDPE